VPSYLCVSLVARLPCPRGQGDRTNGQSEPLTIGSFAPKGIDAVGFRFQRRIALFPGVRLNISKSGMSLSIGPRGLGVTISRRGIHLNTGIPGTGLSYRKRLRGGSSRAKK